MRSTEYRDLDHIKSQSTAADWIHESQHSLVNRAHCEHSESMTYLCRVCLYVLQTLYNNIRLESVRAEDYVCGGTNTGTHPCLLCLAVLSQAIRRWLRFTLVCEGQNNMLRVFNCDRTTRRKLPSDNTNSYKKG